MQRQVYSNKGKRQQQQQEQLSKRSHGRSFSFSVFIVVSSRMKIENETTRHHTTPSNHRHKSTFGFVLFAVSSHYDAVSDAEEIFVFIISTEKPQAAKPKAIMNLASVFMCAHETKSESQARKQSKSRQKSI
ncbi:CLUMA_CG019320, isoform A [Clunio marinus]|uniref:CLUMA_CG019320, isoform A n=1 Tax=Clunio marinus TaxID=568069 RepID=A0A1J1J3T9_9DIPT|nr:CLUMA_CG019320, isoform A [Clunio marinus]